MAIKPKTGTDVLTKDIGTGTLADSLSQLAADPTAYYYEKFKRSGSKYLDDTMWAEAARRGETAALVDTIVKPVSVVGEVTTKASSQS